MPDTISGVKPPLEFIPPNFDAKALWFANRLLPLITRTKTTLRDIDTQNVERLVELFQQFQAGKVRLLLAFRHPSSLDPFCLANLLWRSLPQTAKATGMSLQRPTHAHFLYDRGIPLWAGNWVTQWAPRLGGIPIHRGKIDLNGLKTARDIFANGKFPLMAAPEGATNGPGISQLGFWCVEDMVKANRNEQVLIVPIGLQYHYITPPWEELRRILTALEKDTGLEIELPALASDTREDVLYKRLYRLGEYLLSVMEAYYTRFFHKTLPAVAIADTSSSSSETLIPRETFAARLNGLLDASLQVAEEFFGVKPRGSIIDRCRRLEQAAWDYIYREDLDLETVSPLDRGLANRIAEEADIRVWHMRLVESFVAVTGNYVREKPTIERFADTTLLIWDMVCRIKGGNSFSRPNLGAQRGVITIGEPISVSDRWEAYKGGRKNAKQAVSDLTQDLQVALEKLIKTD